MNQKLQTSPLSVDLRVIDSRILENDFFLQYGTPGSAGVDLRACVDEKITLLANEWRLVSTGVHIHINDRGYAALILPRSGLGHKKGIVLGNLVGLIDSDYQGPLMMSLWNRSDTTVEIEPMERVAQLIFVPVMQVNFNVVQCFSAVSKRGEGGFGSTGV
jgi:dUTP pyrophosphatase